MTDSEHYLRAPKAPPQDLEAEQSTLGAVFLLGNRALDTLATELRLSADHFYRVSHGHIYNAMLAVAENGDTIDPETVWHEIHRRNHGDYVGGKAMIELLAGSVPAAGNYKAYGRRVIELANWRARLHSVYGQLEAIATFDVEAFNDALIRDQLADAGHEGLMLPEDLASMWVDWYDRTEDDSLPTPWFRVNEALFGGLRPGDFSVWGGWPGMGKTSAGDQVLEHVGDELRKRALPYSGCAYVNEMSVIDRTSRLLAARAPASFKRIMKRELSPNEIKAALTAAPNLPFAIQPCAGWSVDAIARHIRHHRWTIAFVDHATRISGARDVADWDRVSRTLADAARQSGTHLMAAVQLNRERATTPARPMPVLRDLRSTGAWEQDARAVIFVHRREEMDREKGVPVLFDDGVISVAKVNNGRLDAERVFLDYAAMRFKVLVEDSSTPRPTTDW